ncbi:MAG: DUF4242 domain-containing protein [Maribacter sp.]|nr:DUF4242 domain-containing protein [Maribacter sp.]
MDIHTVDSDSFSVEDVVKAHMQDLAIQDQFGVTQLKYWVNEGAKTLFCLMQGPDKEACHQVHLQSHGNTACNIIEVSDNEYNLFMGVGTDINDLAQTHSGDLDTGYRTILLMSLISLTGNGKQHSKQIHRFVEQYNGVVIREPHNEFMVSFIYASDALLCVNAIESMLNSSKGPIQYAMAICSGRPVDEEGDKMFEETKKKVKSLCSLGMSKRIYLDRESQILSDKEHPSQEMEQDCFSILDDENINLAMELSNILTLNLTRSDFNSMDLTASLGLSKSQAYRKIKGLTGLAPNQLIQESRLQKALGHLEQGNKTISEVAYGSGFNSPTYFTRVFKKRFGISPIEFTKQQS